MLKREISKKYISTNADNSTTRLVSNNAGATRQMIRYNVNDLRKERNDQVKNDMIVYGDPTPHDKYDAKQLLQSWNYNDKKKQVNADLLRFQKSPGTIQRLSNVNIDPFRFKIGNKHMTPRLDDMEKEFAIKRSEAIFTENDVNEQKHKCSMRHGAMNQYENGVDDIMKDNVVQNMENLIDNRKNPSIEDPLMQKLQQDGRVYQIFSTKLKKRIDNPTKFSNSQLKKFNRDVIDKTEIRGPVPNKTYQVNRYDTEPAPQGT